MTRAEAASVFAKLFDLTDDAAKTTFPDLNEGYWGYSAMNKAINAGIITGTKDGLADPTGTLTREQFFVMLARALGLEEQETTSGLPADGGKWSAGYINALTDRGYIAGTNVNGKLAVAARESITRASVMKLLDQTIPAGGGADADAQVSTPTAYTLRTVRQLLADKAEKNIAYSPANLYLALCMLAETAGGSSRAQILDLLGLEGIEQTREKASSLWNELYRDDAVGKTLLANSIWLNEQFTFKNDTTDTLKNIYRADAFREPMGDKATNEKIESWIDKNTNHMLKPNIKTNIETLMMLVSALYFKGTWVDEFKTSITREDTFTTADGTEQKIDFMHKVKDGIYYRGDGFTAAPLPFKDDTKMWFLLPDEGASISENAMAQLVTRLDLGDGLEHGEVHWSMPKFDMNSGIDLIPVLKALGVTDIFDEYLADFSPLTDQGAVLYEASHAVRVKVDEKGAEAAAVTGFGSGPTSVPPKLPIIEMDLDRPFGFLITGADGLPLFVGVVNTME